MWPYRKLGVVRENELGQAIGEALQAGWSPPPHPSRQSFEGRLMRVEPLEIEVHAKDL